MKTWFFLGERPSAKALTMNVRWEDGRLAAKQLFDALRANGIAPESCRFDNVLLPTLETKPRRKPWISRTVARAVRRGETIVAMGQRVATVLRRMSVEHIVIVHPAARGKIRKKAAYAAHVKEALIG